MTVNEQHDQDHRDHDDIVADDEDDEDGDGDYDSDDDDDDDDDEGGRCNDMGEGR